MITTSTPATMIKRVKEQLFFACPHCGADDQHSVDHFLNSRSDYNFGSWQCDACGWVVQGIWHQRTKSVSIIELTEQPKPIKGYMLLRIASSKTENPVWFVIEDTIHTRNGLRSLEEEIESKRYWVNEQTCPTNILRVNAIIEGRSEDYDDDPHGVLEFAGWAPRPPDQPDHEPPDWRTIFPQLGNVTIEISPEAAVRAIGRK